MATKTYTAPLTLKLGEGEEGSFRATFATLMAIDKDRDVTVPGAFQQGQKVKIAAWGHDWGALTVGKGQIFADEQTAWVQGQFNLATDAGREHYETVKFNGADQEWSYGFEVQEWSLGEFEGEDVRFLRALNVFEVSPVMLGAGIGTRTDSIKAADAKPLASEHACRLRDPGAFQADSFRRVNRESDGKRYSIIMGRLKGETAMTEQAYRYPKDVWSVAEARAHCRDHDGGMFEPAADKAGCGCLTGPPALDLQTATADLAWLLADLKTGQPQLSAARRERLCALSAQMAGLVAEIDSLLAEATPKPRDEESDADDAAKAGRRRWLECQRILARRHGVAV